MIYHICITDSNPKILKSFYDTGIQYLRIFLVNNLASGTSFRLEKVESTGMYRISMYTICPSEKFAMDLWNELNDTYELFKKALYPESREDS